MTSTEKILMETLNIAAGRLYEGGREWASTLCEIVAQALKGKNYLDAYDYARVLALEDKKYRDLPVMIAHIAIGYLPRDSE